MRNRKVVLTVLFFLMVGLIMAQTSQRIAVLGFEAEERASRTTVSQIMHNRRGDFIRIFADYPQYELISQNEVNAALSSVEVSDVRNINVPIAVSIAEELKADILIWGTVSEISSTEVRVLANLMSSQSQKVDQMTFNVRKPSAERVVGFKENLVDKIAGLTEAELTRLFDLGEQQVHLENYEGARSTFTRVVEIEPKNIEAWFYLGYISFTQRDYDGAVEYCSKGLEIAPNDERLLNYKAEAQIKERRFEDAIETLEKLGETQEDELTWIRIANVYLEINDVYEAIDVLNKALKINSESEQAHYILGVVLFDNGEIEESIPHLEFYAERFPEDDVISRKLTTAYMRTDRLDEAIVNYRSQIERNPENVTAYLNLAGALRSKDDNRKALETLKELAAFEKDNPTVHVRMSDVYISLNNLSEAEKNANKAKSLNEDLHEPYMLLAQIAQIRGYEKYEKFLELEETAKSAFGAEADRLIDERDATRNEANRLFRDADSLLNTASSKESARPVAKDIGSRRQLLKRLIDETKKTFFD